VTNKVPPCPPPSAHGPPDRQRRLAVRVVWLGCGWGPAPGRVRCRRCGCREHRAVAERRCAGRGVRHVVSTGLRPVQRARRRDPAPDARRLARRLNRSPRRGRCSSRGRRRGAARRSGRGRARSARARAARDPAGVRAASLAELDGQWAAIVFWHSLEHMPDPARSSSGATRLLMRGGVLVVAVPNASSLQARVFGDRWLALDLPRHLVHLPAPLVLETLRSLSLSIERVSSWRGGQVLFGWLHGLVAALPGTPTSTSRASPRGAQARAFGPAAARGPGGSRCARTVRGGRSRDGDRPRPGRDAVRGGQAWLTQRRSPMAPSRVSPPAAAGEGHRRDAGDERGEDAARDRGKHPARLGRRGHPRRRPLHRRHAGDRARPAAAPRVAPSQRRLRRKPEDVLPRGPAARRRRRGHAASRRSVRGEPDPEPGRAGPHAAARTWSSARASPSRAWRSRTACRAGRRSRTARSRSPRTE
jgi:hypothetical protein